MKKILITISIVSVLAVGALAFAHGTGGWGGGHIMGSGHMMEQGYGNHMMGNGHMMGQMSGGGSQDQKFLDETAELRRELLNKKFEYFEAARRHDAKPDMMSKMERDIFDIQQKIRDKSPRRTDGGFRGLGCW